MTSNREERERLRQQRLAQQASQGSSDRRRLIVGYVTAGVLAAAVLAGLVAVIASGGDDGGGTQVSGDCGNAQIDPTVGSFEGLQCDNREGAEPAAIQFGDLEESARMAGCQLRLDLPDEGSTHFTDENKGTYKTNPPNSGDHFASNEAGSGATADGAYLSTPPESRLVHAMEHGRVQIRYDRDALSEQEQLALKGVFDEDPGGMIMVPDPDLPAGTVIALSAWTNTVTCPSYDPLVIDVVRNFRDTFRGNGPENIPFG